MHSVMSSLAHGRPTHPLSEEQELELLELTHRILHPECERSACCAVSAGQPVPTQPTTNTSAALQGCRQRSAPHPQARRSNWNFRAHTYPPACNGLRSTAVPQRTAKMISSCCTARETGPEQNKTLLCFARFCTKKSTTAGFKGLQAPGRTQSNAVPIAPPLASLISF